MLRGEKIYLTAIEKKELKQLMNWRNNENFRKYFHEYKELNMDMQQKWYEEKVLKDPSTIMFGIHRNSDDKLVGCCGLVYINWVCKHADLSFYIGLNNYYVDNKGYAFEACRLLVDYAFKNLGLNKVWSEIYSFDEKKKKFFEKIGLKVDAVLRENYFYDGKFQNSYIYSMLASERKSCFKDRK